MNVNQQTWIMNFMEIETKIGIRIRNKQYTKDIHDFFFFSPPLLPCSDKTNTGIIISNAALFEKQKRKIFKMFIIFFQFVILDSAVILNGLKCTVTDVDF